MAKYGTGPGKEGRKGDTFHVKSCAKDRQEMAVAKRVAKAAPPDSTKGKALKDSPAAKGPGPDDYMKGMKKPKGGGK